MKRLLAVIMTLAICVLPVNALTASEKMTEMISVIESNYYGEAVKDELLEAAYKGMLDALDKHSVYFSPKDLQSFNSSIKGSYVGIGVSINPQETYIEVVTPFEGSPAQRAGIKPGDRIIKVDGTAIAGMASEKVIAMIKGEAGTSVILTIDRDGFTAPRDFTLTREAIVIKNVYHSKVEGYDVFRITGFNKNVADELKTAMDNAQIDKGIVIDLRNNPGGLLGEVTKMADFFLPEGQLITAIDYAGDKKHEYVAKTSANTIKMAVLVNEGSASASELFAGAMQDTGRAVIVGTQSYGKGSVQTVFPISDGSAIKLTIAKYMTPNGTFIHGVGITPNIVVKPTEIVDDKVASFYPMNSLINAKLGDNTIDAYGLEQRLAYLGYQIVPDGKFDKATENALKDYESRQGFTVDGILDVDVKINLQQQVLDKATRLTHDIQMTRAIEYLNAN